MKTKNTQTPPIKPHSIAEIAKQIAAARGLTQYSSLPLLLDEYRQDTIEPEKEEALRGAFDRSSGLKGIADASKKTRNPIWPAAM